MHALGRKSQNVFLLMDEVSCNSNPANINYIWGRSTIHWKGLKLDDIHLMVALKTVADGTITGTLTHLFNDVSSRGIATDNLFIPQNLTHLKLRRIYRCTTNISQFYEHVAKSLKKPSTLHYSAIINSDLVSFVPGHEINGEPPEILLLPKCNCYTHCELQLEHYLIANKERIFELLKRVQLKLRTLSITVIVDIGSKTQNCVIWLNTELMKEDFTRNIVVKTIEQCRGIEFPVLVTISNDRMNKVSSLIDSWTRVTSTLIIIHLEGKSEFWCWNDISFGLKEALNCQLAVRAKEHVTVFP